MGMCKVCGEVFSALEMTNGICKNCATSENFDKVKEEDDLGFQWWTTWAWLGIILGNLLIVVELYLELSTDLTRIALISIVPIVLNTILMIFVLKYNKYAFLIATVLTLNPILWIINGIYLKNRWNHPKVNQKNIDG